ncbi:DUF6788 family protein [Intrasporangium sp.]|uniref:DUF6788 family protein n=1 Tax=Intrasporangium sp. TaxID=1925024 RepID=UPI0032215277
MSKPAQELPFAATRRALAEALGQIDGLLPGSLVVRMMRCGKRNCACKADPPVLHGPYTQWTRTVAGKTVTKILTDEQLARYQPWFDNTRRLRDLVTKLEIASLHAITTSDQPRATSDAPASASARRPRKPRDNPRPGHESQPSISPAVGAHSGQAEP